LHPKLLLPILIIVLIILATAIYTYNMPKTSVSAYNLTIVSSKVTPDKTVLILMDLASSSLSAAGNLTKILKLQGVRVTVINFTQRWNSYQSTILNKDSISGIIIHVDGPLLRSLYDIKAVKFLEKAVDRGALVVFYSESGIDVDELVDILKLLVRDRQLLSRLVANLQGKTYEVIVAKNGSRIVVSEPIENRRLYVFGFKLRRLANGYEGFSVCSFTAPAGNAVTPVQLYNFILTCLREVK